MTTYKIKIFLLIGIILIIITCFIHPLGIRPLDVFYFWIILMFTIKYIQMSKKIKEQEDQSAKY